MTQYIGQQLGNYRIVRLLGEGGFADVYLGEHVYLKTTAAIKVLHAHVNEINLQSFIDEAKFVATLKHPHIVRVLDFGVDKNTPFLVMEYAPKGSLRQRHQRGSIVPLARVVSYTKAIAEALQYSHNQKLIHRDIKPENVLIGPQDEILLSDFGVAVEAHSTYSRKSENVSGTIQYMAPEQFTGNSLQASDQYALATVVYEWLCGEPPFTGGFPQLMYQHIHVAPTPLRQKNPAVPLAVEQVVLKALSKDPAQRFPSVQDFSNALEQAVAGKSPVNIPPPPPPNPARQAQQPLVPPPPPNPVYQPQQQQAARLYPQYAAVPQQQVYYPPLQQPVYYNIPQAKQKPAAYLPLTRFIHLANMVPVMIGYGALLLALLTLGLFTDPYLFHPSNHPASAYSFFLAFVILPSSILLAGVLLGGWLGAVTILFCGLAWLIMGGIVGSLLHTTILFGTDIFPAVLTIIGCSITPLVVGTLYKRRQFGGGGQAAAILLLGSLILGITIGVVVMFYLFRTDTTLVGHDAAYDFGYGIGVILVFLLLGGIVFLPALILERIIYAITARNMKSRNPQRGT